MKKIFTLFAFLGVFAFCANAQKTETQNVETTTGKINCDGFIDPDEPWGDTWLDIDLTKDPALANDADYTSKFQVLNTADAIVFAFVVTDDTPDNTGSGDHEKDCIELFFNMDPTYKEKAKIAGCWQIRFHRIPEDKYVHEGYFDGFAAGSAIDLSPDFQFGIEDTDDEYTVEIAFPKVALDSAVNFNGVDFNLELQVANCVDGARTGQHFWGNNSDNQWQDYTLLSPFKIVGGEVSAKEMSAAKGSAFVKNNVLNVKNVNGLVSIFSVNGSLVSKAIVNGNGSIDIADLKSGIYFIKGNNISEKFVK